MNAPRGLLLALALSSTVAAGLRSQNPPAPPQPQLVLDARLGGDSAQAVLARLRLGALYRVEVRPATADVQFRPRSRSGETPPPLTPGAPPPGPDLVGVRAFSIVPTVGGDHVIELTNPGVGATDVRLWLVRRSPADTLPATARRELVFSDNITGGPVEVFLDSGVVYRVVPRGGGVYISPRSAYMAPVRFSPLVRGGGSGEAFVTNYGGPHRLWPDESEPAVSVQIFREDMDAVEMACIADPRAPGCGQAPDATGRRRVNTGVVALLALLPFIAWVLSSK